MLLGEERSMHVHLPPPLHTDNIRSLVFLKKERQTCYTFTALTKSCQ